MPAAAPAAASGCPSRRRWRRGASCRGVTDAASASATARWRSPIRRGAWWCICRSTRRRPIASASGSPTSMSAIAAGCGSRRRGATASGCTRRSTCRRSMRASCSTRPRSMSISTARTSRRARRGGGCTGPRRGSRSGARNSTASLADYRVGDLASVWEKAQTTARAEQGAGHGKRQAGATSDVGRIAARGGVDRSALAGGGAGERAARRHAGARCFALSDIHYVSRTTTCGHSPGPETDPTLLRAAQAEARRVIGQEKPAFVIYLGDLPSHCGNHHRGYIVAALTGLARIAGKDARLIYVPGNNDSLDGDYGPFTGTGGTPIGQTAPWSGSPVLNIPAADMIDTSHLAMGYYAVFAMRAAAPAPSLRVLALNTTMFPRNYGQLVPTRKAEAGDQLEWLADQLQAARTAGDRVIVAMHVPPGFDGYGGNSGSDVVTMWDGALAYDGHKLDAITGWPPGAPAPWVQRVFLQIVAAYRPEIVGLVSSHTHYNELRRLRDCSQAAPNLGAFTELDVAIPGITTDHC